MPISPGHQNEKHTPGNLLSRQLPSIVVRVLNQFFNRCHGFVQIGLHSFHDIFGQVSHKVMVSLQSAICMLMLCCCHSWAVFAVDIDTFLTEDSSIFVVYLISSLKSLSVSALRMWSRRLLEKLFALSTNVRNFCRIHQNWLPVK